VVRIPIPSTLEDPAAANQSLISAQQSLTSGPNRAITGAPTTGNGFSTLPTSTFKIGFAGDQKNLVTYYEAIFKKGTSYYVGTAIVGEAYLTVGVPPDAGYEVLVLAGVFANNDPGSGERVLLGSGYRSPVAIVGGTVNRVAVKMYSVNVTMRIKAMASEATANTSPTTIFATLYNSGDNLRFFKIAKATNPYDTTSNVWWNNTFKDLEIDIDLWHLSPLFHAAGDDTISPFTGSERVRVDPLSYRNYSMRPIVFDPGTTVLAGSTGPVLLAPVPEGGFSSHKILTCSYTIAAGTSATDTYIPGQAAAGAFYFNYSYLPFGVQGTIDKGASVWNVRNRILWGPNGYYGGGVVFLFGDATLDNTSVIVDPKW
jgi:hypothetical protein